MRVALLLLIVSCLVGCGDNAAVASKAATPFEVIAHGEVVDLAPYVQPGHVTVFDFYAEWCPPCKKLDRSLVNMKQTYGDKLQVYKLDIVQWGSKLSEHHGIKDLPYLMVYDNQGALLEQGPSNKVLPELMRALNQ